jgi:hypothetical protein
MILFNSLVAPAHKLPDDCENQFLVFMHNVQSADVHHGEPHRFANLHSVVAVLNLLEDCLGIFVCSDTNNIYSHRTTIMSISICGELNIEKLQKSIIYLLSKSYQNRHALLHAIYLFQLTTPGCTVSSNCRMMYPSPRSSKRS